MSFNFQNPSIHGVTGVSAEVMQVHRGPNAGKFACLTIVLHGADGEKRYLEAYFDGPNISKAIATAAVINAVSGIPQDEAEAA